MIIHDIIILNNDADACTNTQVHTQRGLSMHNVTKSIGIINLLLLQKKALGTQSIMIQEYQMLKIQDCSEFMQIRSHFIIHTFYYDVWEIQFIPIQIKFTVVKLSHSYVSYCT